MSEEVDSTAPNDCDLPVEPRVVAPRSYRRPRLVQAGTGLLVLAGLGLIALGPPAPRATLPPSSVLVTDAVVAAPPASVAATPPSPTADAGHILKPTWRVAFSKSEPDAEVVEGRYGKRGLATLGLSRAEQKRLVHAFEGIHRLDRAPTDASFVLAKDKFTGTVLAFEHIASPIDVWQAKMEDGGLVAKKLELDVEKKKIASALVVGANLDKAVAAAGLRPEATRAIDDALEGHVELAALKSGVRLRVVGSEDWVEGEFARFHVDALEIVAKGTPPTRIYLFESDGRHPHSGYYDAKGQQPYRGTFRSPLVLTRITSRFNPHRMHPVLHTVMPHNGVDFGASSGTPVYASAAGTVSTVGDGGRCGNMIQIDHGNGLTTGYCHLSKFATGLHSGQHVDAKQLIGYVGQTGSATGPHLHFAVKRGGMFIDPVGIKMDGVKVLPSGSREAFNTARPALDAELDAIALPADMGFALKDDDDAPTDE